jgi:hypothetical protein
MFWDYLATQGASSSCELNMPDVWNVNDEKYKIVSISRHQYYPQRLYISHKVVREWDRERKFNVQETETCCFVVAAVVTYVHILAVGVFLEHCRDFWVLMLML